MIVKDKNGMNPLMLACRNPNPTQIKNFLNKVNLNSTDYFGRNCLHHLCLNTEEKDVLFDCLKLIQSSSLTHVKDNDGKIPVEYSIMHKLYKLTQLILEIDDRVDIKLCYDYNFIIADKPLNVNRYGFYETSHDKCTLFRVKKYSKSKIKKQTERIYKWKKMMYKPWFIYPKKLERRVYKGVPDEIRSDYWKKILNINDLNKIYIDEFNKFNQLHCKSPHDKQLDLDVSRSFQFNYKFNERFGDAQKKLFYVIHALTLHNPSAGYVQGITCVASMLVLFLDDKTSYCALINLLNEKFKWKEMFEGFELLKKCWNVTRKLIETRHIKIAQHFHQLGIMDYPLPFFMFEWHYLWFIHSLKFEIALRVFDVILFEGFTALFSVAHTIFHFIENEILKEKDPNILQQKLRTPMDLINKNITANTFMSFMYKHRIDGSYLMPYFS